MSHWEALGRSDEWYTPAYVFEALGEHFDMDVAGPPIPTHVPTDDVIIRDSLAAEWVGFIWMNPPYGGRNSLAPWLSKFFAYGNGIGLAPDRTSAPWWQTFAPKADVILFVSKKIKFIGSDGNLGKSPADGTCLFASGVQAVEALRRAERNGLGFIVVPDRSTP